MSKKKPEQKPKVNPELEGFDVNIDEFGEITSTLGIEKINDFLNKKLYDKKLDNQTENHEAEDKKED